MEENLIGNSFTWFKQFNAQIAEMTEEEQFAFIPEVVLWAAFGREPSFMDAKGDQTARYMKQAFLGMKSSLDSSIKSQNRNTGGAPKKKKASGKKKGTGDDNPPTEPPYETPLDNPPQEPPCVTPIQNLRKEKIREEKIRQEKKRESKPSFSLQCLKALNEELRGVAPVEFTRNPNGEYIASLEGRFTVDDVREMVRFKRKEWEGTKFQQNLNPGTLFSPDKLEGYVIASKMKEPAKSIRGRKVMDDELASYAS
jgi:uncharacterized phage protein (TIGR02220 family)